MKVLLSFTAFCMSLLLVLVVDAAQSPMCPTSPCVERLVTADDDSGSDARPRDGNLRDVITHACEEDGDDAIQFGFFTPIQMERPLTIPRDCNGKIFVYGRPRSRNLINGEGAAALHSDQPNCLIRVESDGNEFSRLNIAGYASDSAEERAAASRIGLCFIGNDNKILDATFGILDEGNTPLGNDVGIWLAGDRNEARDNHLSQNKLDGIQISGNHNVVQGNFLGFPLENCDAEVSTRAQELRAEPSREGDPAMTEKDPESRPERIQDAGDAPETTVSPPPFAGGCQLMPPPGDSPQTRGQSPSGSGASCPLVSNWRHGIHLFGDAHENLIAGSGPHTGESDGQDDPTRNTLQYNGTAGIRLSGSAQSVRNLLSPNIFNLNHGLGIDLADDGVTKDDEGDLDQGPNEILNRPELSFVLVRDRYAAQGNVRAVVYGRAASDVSVHLYGGDGVEPGGFAEGFRYLRSVGTSPTDPHFSVSLPNIPLGTPLVALVVDDHNNTSEFSFLNLVELDSDVDGIPDRIEDLNQNGIVDRDETDPFDPDTDGDGLVDGIEDANRSGSQESSETAGFFADSDGDEVSDFVETHGDGIFDHLSGDTDPLNPDTDGDGRLDGDEDQNSNGLVETFLGESFPLLGD